MCVISRNVIYIITFNKNTICYRARVVCSDIYECEDKGICLNNGTCVDTAEAYYCLCQNGWTGDNCQIGEPQTRERTVVYVCSCDAVVDAETLLGIVVNIWKNIYGKVS